MNFLKNISFGINHFCSIISNKFFLFTIHTEAKHHDFYSNGLKNYEYNNVSGVI